MSRGWVVVGYSHRRYYIAACSHDGKVPLYTVQAHLGEFGTWEEAEQEIRLRHKTGKLESAAVTEVTSR